jgi:hypothetical protein
MKEIQAEVNSVRQAHRGQVAEPTPTNEAKRTTKRVDKAIGKGAGKTIGKNTAAA